MPSRTMAANLAKVLGGETAAAAALWLWGAGVHEERGLTEGIPADPASDEPLSAPTALDIARMILGDNERATADEFIRQR